VKTILATLALAFALLGLAPAAQAGLILQPAAASTDMGTFSFFSPPDNTRNQSGLSAGYTSLVTDFDTYIASNPTHNSLDVFNDWRSNIGIVTGSFDFDLGGTFTIQSFALWNIGSGQFSLANVRGFELLADDNAAFSSPTSLGSFDANPNTGPDTAVLPGVFPFAPTSAAFVRMVITSNNGAIVTEIGEAAFEVQSSPAAVPEPASMGLLAAGGLGLLGYGWRRRARAVRRSSSKHCSLNQGDLP
jgi:hypothetical protein